MFNKFSSNLNRSEPEHILSELCLVTTDTFYQSKFVFFFGAK